MSFDVNIGSAKPVIKAAANTNNDGGSGGNLGYMMGGGGQNKKKIKEVCLQTKSLTVLNCLPNYQMMI